MGSEANNHDVILFGLRECMYVCNAFTEQVHEVVYAMNTWSNENTWIGLSKKRSDSLYPNKTKQKGEVIDSKHRTWTTVRRNGPGRNE